MITFQMVFVTGGAFLNVDNPLKSIWSLEMYYKKLQILQVSCLFHKISQGVEIHLWIDPQTFM